MLKNPTLHSIAIVIRGTLVSCLVAALFGGLSLVAVATVRALWNALLPDSLVLPWIDYWQALGIGVALVLIWNLVTWRRSV